MGIVLFVALVIVSLLAMLMNFVIIEHLKNTISINGNLQTLIELQLKENSKKDD